MAQIIGIFLVYLLYLIIIRHASAESSTEESTTWKWASVHFEEIYEMNGVSFKTVPVTVEEFPYVVSIFVGKKYICSATLVGKRWAVTRAHILADLQETGEEFTAIVVSGATYPDLLEHCPHNKKSAIQEIIVHEKYDAEKRIHDIGLVKLVDELEMTVVVQAVKFATRHDTHDRDLPELYDECFFLGHFQLNTMIKNNSYITRRLHKTAVIPIPMQECRQKFDQQEKSMLSSDFECGAHCAIMDFVGPWGGPLVCGKVGNFTMYGLRAHFFGKAGIEDTLPVVFTRIDKHSDWLRYKISSNAMSAFKTITVATHLVMVVSALICYNLYM